MDQLRNPQPATLEDLDCDDMQDNDYLTKDTGAGGAGFSSQWGAGFMHSVRDAIVQEDDSGRNMYALRDFISQRFNARVPAGSVYRISRRGRSNGGPETRARIDLARQRRQFLLAKTLNPRRSADFHIAGIPMIFMGQEFLEWGAWPDATPLDWSKVDRFSGILNLYRDLIHLRRNWFDTTRGLKGHEINVHHVNNGDKVIAFHRWDQGGPRDDVIVVANFANRAYDTYRIGFPRGGTWRVRFNGDWRGYSPVFSDHASYDLSAVSGGNSDNMPNDGDVSIGPYTALILSQDD
jgi:1,4-alpha-glucan branching enzyme